MKRNTLSLSLLLSTAMIVPTLAMADLTGYNDEAAAGVSTMQADDSLAQSDELLVTPDQPNVDNGYATQTIDQNGNMTPDSDYATPAQPELGSESELEVNPALTDDVSTEDTFQ